MNKKGFTLVELIAVVVVLAIIALIAVPAVSGYLDQADQSYYDSVVSSVLASGRDYYSDYHTLLPKSDGDVTVLPLQELIDDGYIDKIRDSENKTDCTGEVYVTRKGNRDYDYCVVIECDGKIKRNSCGDSRPTIPNKEFEIMHHDTINIPQCSTYEQMLGQVTNNDLKHNNKLVGLIVKLGTTEKIQNNGQNILVYPDESKLNLNALGSYKLTYEYAGASSVKTNVYVNDVEKPNQENLKIKFYLGSKTGEEYICDSDTCPWKNKNVVIKFEGTDLTTLNGCNEPGSGITTFYYKLDGITTNGATLKTDYRPVVAYRTGDGKYTGYVKIPENEFKGSIYYNAKDKAEKYAYETGHEPSRYLKIDTIKPTIAIKGLRQDNNGEVASGTWVNSKLKFTFTETSGISGHKEYYCFDNNNTCTPTASSTLISGNAVTRNDVGDYYIRHITISNAGTKSDVHSYNGKVDLETPTCSNSGGVSTWVNRSITITGTCSDTGGSGCTGNASKSWSANGTNLKNQSPGTVCDAANNCRTCASNQTVMIDTGAPSCGTNNGTTTWGTGTRNVTVRCSDDYSGCTNSYYTNGFGGNTKYGNITIADNAGNTNSCSVPVFLDNTAPTGTISYHPEPDGVRGTASITCSDTGGSGIVSGHDVTKTFGDASYTISTTCYDVAGNSKYVSKTYTKKYSGTIKCYHYSCSSGSVSGSRCKKAANTEWCYYDLSGWSTIVSAYTCGNACDSLTVRGACGSGWQYESYDLVTCLCKSTNSKKTCDSGWGSPASDGNCYRDATKVDDSVACSASNYTAPEQACRVLYAENNCTSYYE